MLEIRRSIGMMGPAPHGLMEEIRAYVDDPRVLRAIASVPRELFVPAVEQSRAWANEALPIGDGQTISQPLVVARMLAALDVHPGDRVLDVGTGSGWHAALLARLGAEVWSVERHARLAETARRALAAAGVEGVTVVVADGTRGLPEHAPFQAINVAAAAPEDVPAALMEQLAPGGRLVAPVGTVDQRLVLVERTPEGLVRSPLEPVRFVPLVPNGPTGAGGAR
jgi:protein-L-isoaspartate(D-aspartate) O-methyltransferase